MPVTKGYVLAAGQSLHAGQNDAGTKASASSTGGSLTLFESTLTSGPPPHVHEREDESFYVLDGSLTAHCGADVLHAGPGGFVFLPRGVPHHFIVDSGPVTVLLIATPGGIEDYFRDMGAAPDDATRQVVRDRYGIQRT